LAVKSEFHGPKGNIHILFGNKSEYTMTQIRVIVPKIEGLNIEYSQVPPLVAPNNQITQLFKVTSLKPISIDVICSIYFEYEKKSYRYNVTLPVSCAKFIEPLDFEDQSSFFGKWNNSELKEKKKFYQFWVLLKKLQI